MLPDHVQTFIDAQIAELGSQQSHAPQPGVSMTATTIIRSPGNRA